ncbi:MAG: RNA-binding protein [Candidatus Altiarchaeales archaeon]|nr:RNA-binding protein [Candidatus Altiarchaeales archaeon]MBD3416767.1 RNA-binding protein [Candidatus Altiarchaeales archaeon]
MVKKCSSCGKEVMFKYAEFSCPQCSGEKIVRCESCRSLASNYSCSKCGFKGP